MQSPQDSTLYSLAGQAYLRGLALHGDLNLQLESYSRRLILVVYKHSRKTPFAEDPPAVFSRLHTDDLYLSVACAHGSDTAWNRLWTLYRKHVLAIANSVCRTRCNASELADSILTHLFLPDGSGRSRIGSYDGLSSLAIWLRSVIHHEAAKERDRKCNHFERLDEFPDIPDCAAIDKLERALRSRAYEPMIRDALAEASKSISERERSILILRFELGQKGAQIAQALHAHPSMVTRQVQQTCKKLKKNTLSMLATKHHLNPSAIEGCVTEMLENPSNSFLMLLKRDDQSAV